MPYIYAKYFTDLPKFHEIYWNSDRSHEIPNRYCNLLKFGRISRKSAEIVSRLLKIHKKELNDGSRYTDKQLLYSSLIITYHFPKLKETDPIYITVMSKSATSLGPLMTSCPSLVTDQTSQKQWYIEVELWSHPKSVLGKSAWDKKVKQWANEHTPLCYYVLSFVALASLKCNSEVSIFLQKSHENKTQKQTFIKNYWWDASH